MKDVWRVYQDIAAHFARDRTGTAGEERYLDEVVRRMGEGARALDLGCGTGEPIARFFLERGYGVTGVDASGAMIALCRERFAPGAWPRAEWIVHDMRTLALPSPYEAILAWDSFFHLPPEDQRSMFAVFRAHAAPGAALLFTSGPEEGVAMGEIYGRELYHASLSPAEYRTLLAAQGFEVLIHRAEDSECGGHTVWLAQSIA